MVWRAMAHRLAVTTETQAKNMEPFLPLGTVGLAWTRSAFRAMVGWEPSGGVGPLVGFRTVCLSPACPSGVEPQECLGLLSPAWLSYLLL